VTVREAAPTDVERMAELADSKRRQYEPFAPTFQRPAANATEVHSPWLARLVQDPDVGTFVNEDESSGVDGFVIITIAPAPPVYDPGGPTSLIDDFTVAQPHLWRTAGAALLDAAREWAMERGAAQLVVISGPHDSPKRALLDDAGLYVASEWFTTPLA
jgi:GNAT superfamily N-acetyltransferase